MFTFHAGLMAQGLTIKGVVYDINKETLPGVSVSVKGAKAGTVTDFDGNYSVAVPSPESILVFSFMGFETKEVQAGSQGVLNVTLKEESKELEEVVVVAYGTQKKQTVTGSISVIKGSDLLETPVANVSNALTGKLPGVITQQPGGRPGEDAANIYIRGISTFGASTAPLIVIDGIEQESFSQLDPNEIENISVLKDASSTAVYGIRGANGVILITTRRGNDGRPKISLSANWGLQQATTIPKFLGSYEHILLRKKAYENDGVNPMISPDSHLFTDEALEGFRTGSDPYRYPNVNWYDAVVNKTGSMQQQYNINVSGGSDRVKYFTSIGYLDQGGMFKYQDLQKEYDPSVWFKRFNFRANIDLKINDFQTLSTNLSARSEELNGKSSLSGVINAVGGIYQGLLAREPWRMPLFNPDGSLAALSAMGNPISDLAYGGNDNVKKNVVDLMGTLHNDLSFITKGLTFDLSFTFSNAYGSKKSYRASPDTYYYDAARNEYFQVGMASPYTFSSEEKVPAISRTNLQLKLAYARNFGQHGLTSVLVYNQQNTSSGKDDIAGIPSALMGYALRMEYSYAYKYLAEFSLGYNGSENFADGYRFGFFPAGSLGYVLSEESFMESLKPVLPYLKLRGSIGLVGNDKVLDANERFLFQALYGTQAGNGGYVGGYPSFLFGTYNPSSPGGIYEKRNENKLLTWETSLKKNIGIEGRLFSGNLLSFSFDIFREDRKDILLQAKSTTPDLAGMEAPYANKGRVTNWGYEIEAQHRNKIGKVEYYIKGNYSFARNKILEEDDVWGIDSWRKKAGYRIGQFKGYQAIGFFKDKNDIQTSPEQSGGIIIPGDLKYLDYNKDGKIDHKDQIPMGYSRIPEITYSFTPGFSWNGFDVSVMFQGVANASIMLTGNAGFEFFGSAGGGQATKKHLNYWTPDNPNPSYPSVHMGAHSNKTPSSFHLQSANYLRVKSAQVGYTFPSALVKKLYMSSMRVYLSGSNLYTWTDVENFDPEMVNTTGDVYPQQRVFNIGININF
jgi:TonB-linked SusC/RagA family outer membrane protein